MSRKELLKRSLGITEYPWSSDDDLDGPSAPTAPDIPAAIRPYDTRTATAPDIISATRSYDPRTANNTPTSAPGPSGLQPWVSSIPRRQAKIERDLFWSLVRSPCNPIRTGPPPFPLPTPNSRQLRQDTVISGNLMHAPAADHRRSIRASNVPDVQRMLAFKRLTRNINALRQRSTTLTTTAPTHSSCPPVPSTPVIRVNRGRHHITMRRYYQPSRGFHCVHRNGNDDVPESSNADNEEPQNVQHGREATAGVAADAERRSPVLPGSPAATPQIQVNINIHNDEEEADNTGPSLSQSILGDEVNLIQDDPSDIEILDNNTTAMSLEEEIVEIDAEDADPLPPSARSPATIDLEEIQANIRDPNLASTSSPAVEPGTLPSKQGVKRKRQDSDDNLEPCTVKDFNLELLRLLECPVCLEWMEPPMSQCRRGHLVCGRCRARLNSCPVCRTTFSSVRNRAMEGVAEMLRYPCRHGCGREVRLRRRGPHEASCSLRKYQCPAPACGQNASMPRQMLAEHFQSKHLPMLKIGCRHKFSIKMSAEQHDNWLILAMDEYFHLRIDVDSRVFVYVAYIGPKCDAKNFTYEVTVEGQHHSRKLVYARSTHCDLESPSVNVSREDCFSLSLDQALNFIRFKNRRCDADKYLDFNVEITKLVSVKDESDS